MEQAFYYIGMALGIINIWSKALLPAVLVAIGIIIAIRLCRRK